MNCYMLVSIMRTRLSRTVPPCAIYGRIVDVMMVPISVTRLYPDRPAAVIATCIPRRSLATRQEGAFPASGCLGTRVCMTSVARPRDNTRQGIIVKR